MIILLLLTAIISLVTVLWYLRRWRLQRMTENIPSLPREVPFMGYTLNFAGDSIHLMDIIKFTGELTSDFGGITKLWFGPVLCFWITDPALAKEVLNAALSKMFLYKYVSAWLGQGMVTSDVPTWRHHRKILSPSFGQQKLNQFLNIFDKEAVNFVKSLEDKVGEGEFDAYLHINQYALDAICQTALGLSDEDKKLENINKYGNMVQQIFHLITLRIQSVWMLIEPLYYWTKMKTREVQIVQSLASISSEIIDKQKSSLHLVHSEECFKSFLTILLEHEATGSVTQQDVRQEVDTIITAGTETITSTLINTIVMLGSFPEVQEKLYNEMKKVFGDSDKAVAKDDLPLLVYTDAILKEAMRLFPSVPIIGRDVGDRDLQIGKFNFPKGSSFILSTIGINRNKSWGDPLVFRPERWLGPEKPTDEAFMTFSHGKRSCIGKSYAMMMMKTVLAHLVRRYVVRSDHKRLQHRWDVTMKPASGSEISIEYRVKSRNLQQSG